MNSDNIIKNLRVLWRTDRIIAEIRMRHLLTGMGLRALAALIAAFGLLMLELAAYFALVQVWSAILAAAILGGINFAMAAILFLIAMRTPASRELDFASEIHGSAIDALQADVRGLQSQAASLIHHPLGGILPLLAPLLATTIQGFRKSTADKGAAASAIAERK